MDVVSHPYKVSFKGKCHQKEHRKEQESLESTSVANIGKC